MPMLEQGNKSENKGNLRSFGRRKGRRLRAQASGLFADLLPDLQISLAQSSAFSFDSTAPLYLEIGFGGGEHLAHIAGLYPEISMLGSEPYINGVSSLLKLIKKNDLKNIRIYSEDVRELLALLPDNCLDRVYILYPDPWPKARHHKRRLIQAKFLDLLARKMKSNSELRIATDWADYCTWILEQILPHLEYKWFAQKSSDWNSPWQDWTKTRYEAKAISEGRKPVYLRFERR